MVIVVILSVVVLNVVAPAAPSQYFWGNMSPPAAVLALLRCTIDKLGVSALKLFFPSSPSRRRK